MSLLNLVLAAGLLNYAEAVKTPGRDVMVLCVGSGWMPDASAYRDAFASAAGKYTGETLWAVYDRREDLDKAAADALGKLPVEFFGYPCLVYIDAKGRPMMQRESVPLYDLGLADTLVAKYDALRYARDEALARAREGPAGLARAEALGKALSPWMDPILSYYSERAVGAYQSACREVVEEIRQNDPGDTLGYRTKYAFAPLLLMEGTVCKNAAKGDFAANDRFIAGLLGNRALLPVQRQYVRLMAFKNEMERAKEGVSDAAVRALEACVAEDPSSALAMQARNVKAYYTRPIRLDGLRWLRSQNRPFWTQARLEVGELVREPGTYRVTFRPQANGTMFRNCALEAGGRVLGADRREARTFRIAVDALGGAVPELVVELRGTGWFEGCGTIEVVKE